MGEEIFNSLSFILGLESEPDIARLIQVNRRESIIWMVSTDLIKMKVIC